MVPRTSRSTGAIALLAGCLAVGLSSAQAAGSMLAIPPMAAPVIDGRDTTAAEWAGAGTLTGWTDRTLGVANKDPTQVRVGHHRGTLYIRMIYPIPEAFRRNSVFYSELPLQKDVDVDDGEIQQDDYLGFYVSPGKNGAL